MNLVVPLAGGLFSLSAFRFPLSALLLAGTIGASPALSQRKEPLPPELAGVGITEQPGARIPLELPFVDSDGRKTTLGSFFDGTHPVILTLNYSDCPMLCGVQLNGLLEALRAMPWNLGEQFQRGHHQHRPAGDARAGGLDQGKVSETLQSPRSAAGWHFLTGREEAIKRLGRGRGIPLPVRPSTRQFVHSAALILCTPDGRVSRYLGGVLYHPQTLRLSLVEASQGKIGSALDQFFLSCFHYDEKAGRYGPFALGIMRIGGALTRARPGRRARVLLDPRGPAEQTEQAGKGCPDDAVSFIDRRDAPHAAHGATGAVVLAAAPGIDHLGHGRQFVLHPARRVDFLLRPDRHV